MTRGASSLRIMAHVYENHTWVTVSKVVDLPVDPSVRRLGHRRVDLGRAQFAGVSLDGVLALVLGSLTKVGTLAEAPDIRPQVPASPPGIMGQLALFRLDSEVYDQKRNHPPIGSGRAKRAP